MAQKFARGDRVRQVMPKPIEGVVTSFKMDEKTGDVVFCVAFPVAGADGKTERAERYFTEAEIEAAKTAEA